VLRIPLRADGEPLDIGMTFVSRTGVFEEADAGSTHDRELRARIPTDLPGARLVGFTFRVGDTGLHENAQAGEFRDDVAVGTLTLGPVPWLDFRDFRATGGLDTRSSAHGTRLRYAVGTSEDSRLQVRQPTDGHLVPVAVSPALAAAAGRRGVLPLDVVGTRVVTRVVAVVRHFPTVHGHLVLADRGAIATALDAAEPGPPFYNEVWLDDPHPDRVAAILERPRFRVLDIQSRLAVEDRETGSTSARGAALVLGIAAVAGLALALVALSLAAFAELRERRAELLDLEAQGLDPRAIVAFVRWRIVLGAGLGIAVAVAAGVALALLVVKTVRVAADLSRPDPPLLLDIDWLLVAAGALVAIVVVAVVSGRIARRAVKRMAGARA
jgi:hypothetical protein